MSDDTMTAEQLKEKLDTTNAELEKLKSQAEFEKSEAKKAFEKRDELKKRLDALEKEGLEKENQFKPLYEKSEAEKSELKKQLDELSPFKDKWTTYESSRRETLLKEVEDAELKEVAGKLDLIDLEKFTAKIKKAPLPTDAGRSGEGIIDVSGKKWDDISSADKEKLKEKQPEIYKQLYYARYKMNPA